MRQNYLKLSFTHLIVGLMLCPEGPSYHFLTMRACLLQGQSLSIDLLLIGHLLSLKFYKQGIHRLRTYHFVFCHRI